MKKAFIVIPHWSDVQNPELFKQGSKPIYAENEKKAKYEYYRSNDLFDDDEWFKYRSLRWQEMDLLPPELHPTIEALTEHQLKKAIHTYAADSENPGYRNYYNGPIDDKDLKRLMALDMMIRNPGRDNNLTKGTTYYHLTDFGIEVVMSTRERTRGSIDAQKAPAAII